MLTNKLDSISGNNPRLFYGYIIVVITFCVAVLAYGTYRSFGVFLEPIISQFGWTRAMTSGAYGLVTLNMGLLGIITGKLNDRFGPKVILVGCGLFMGAGYLLASQMDAIWQLYLFYGLMVGTGMSGIWVPTASTVARWFVKKRG